MMKAIKIVGTILSIAFMVGLFAGFAEVACNNLSGISGQAAEYSSWNLYIKFINVIDHLTAWMR